jgi:hypothetical protein
MARNTSKTNASAEISEPLAIVKSNLDLAWVKIQNGLQQEAEGHKLWIEGTLELINILDDARQRYPSDQEFGKRLTDIGYGENRITRNDRSALLNMAEYPDLTREVLEQTYRRSWRLIWEEEIQPRLHNAGQPADGGSPEEAPAEPADDNAEAPAVTRRPKKIGAKREANGVQKPEGLRDMRGWLNNQVKLVNGVTDEVNKVIANCTPEQRDLLATLELTLLLDASQKLTEKAAELVDRVDTPLENATDALMQQDSRVVVTPAPKRARRASQREA